jgi:predicted nucleic acid-binding protein
MPAFFDSSVLLSILLNDRNSVTAAEVWSAHEDRTASVLMEVECLSVLRRTAKQVESRLSPKWLGDRMGELETRLADISLKEIDGAVIDVIRHEGRLGGCRSLDSIHLATALLFQAAAGAPLYVCTLDKQMAETCKRLGLEPIP